EVPDAVGYQLPVGHAPAVGAPAPAVLQAELLFIHPVEGAVDDRTRAVLRQLGDRAAGQVLDIEIVLPHVAHPSAIGRKLGEHQGGGSCRGASELLQLAAFTVQYPVVPAGIGTP